MSNEQIIQEIPTLQLSDLQKIQELCQKKSMK